MKNTFKKVSSAFVAVATALVLMTSAVFAANPALIDESRAGSITIHKFDNSGTGGGAEHNGTELNNVSGLGNPLGGVSFTVSALPYSVTDNVSLTDAIDYLANNVGAVTQHTLTTNSKGIAAFQNLPLGVYLVQEADNSGIEAAIAPFLVSLPMTNSTDDASWLYDVHVYPKNTVRSLAITKEIVDENGNPSNTTSASVGDTVDWVIVPSIPADIASIDLNNTGYFFITDNLDARLTYKSVVVTLLDSAGDPVHNLQDGAHYTLTAPKAGEDGGLIKIDFNTALGITELTNALLRSYSLQIMVSTEINENALDDLSQPISNSASLYYKNEDGDPSNPEPPVTPETPSPEITLAGIALYKWAKDESQNEIALADAAFTIYASEADARNGDAMQLNGNDWTLISDSEGYLYFPVADLEAVVGALTGTESFYIVETKAPTGYELLNSIIEVKLNTTTKVENFKLNAGFTLPVTGGTGTVMFTIAGLGLIAAAVIVFVIFKKKEQKKDDHNS